MPLPYLSNLPPLVCLLSELHGRRLPSSGDGSALTLTLATSHQNYTV